MANVLSRDGPESQAQFPVRKINQKIQVAGVAGEKSPSFGVNFKV